MSVENNAQKEKKSDIKKSKFRSAKLWVTIWAIFMVSFIVIANRSEFIIIAQLLCGVPVAYIRANVWQKQIFSKSEFEQGK